VFGWFHGKHDKLWVECLDAPLDYNRLIISPASPLDDYTPTSACAFVSSTHIPLSNHKMSFKIPTKVKQFPKSNSHSYSHAQPCVEGLTQRTTAANTRVFEGESTTTEDITAILDTSTYTLLDNFYFLWYIAIWSTAVCLFVLAVAQVHSLVWVPLVLWLIAICFLAFSTSWCFLAQATQLYIPTHTTAASQSQLFIFFAISAYSYSFLAWNAIGLYWYDRDGANRLSNFDNRSHFNDESQPYLSFAATMFFNLLVQVQNNFVWVVFYFACRLVTYMKFGEVTVEDGEREKLLH
jgi:hypothetical protein